MKNKVGTFICQDKLRLVSDIDAKEAIYRCNERILVYTRKIDIHQKRKAYSQENVTFELYRRCFYGNMKGKKNVIKVMKPA